MLNKVGVVALRNLELLPRFWGAPKILELLPGFWSKIWKFIRSFKKNAFKKSQISVQVACGDHTVLIIAKLTTYVLPYTLKIIGIW